MNVGVTASLIDEKCTNSRFIDWGLVHFLLIVLECRVDSVLDFRVECASVRFGELSG